MAEEKQQQDVASEPAPERILSVEELCAEAPDVEYDLVDLRPYGVQGSLRLGSVSAEEMLEFAETNEGPAKKTAGLRLLLRSVVDAQGKRIGSDKLIGALKKKNSRLVNDLAERALQLSGLAPKAKETAKNASGGAA